MKLNRDEVMQIRRLSSVRTLYVSDRILYSMNSVMLSQQRECKMGDVTKLRGLDNSTCKIILDLLEAGYLRFG